LFSTYNSTIIWDIPPNPPRGASILPEVKNTSPLGEGL